MFPSCLCIAATQCYKDCFVWRIKNNCCGVCSSLQQKLVVKKMDCGKSRSGSSAACLGKFRAARSTSINEFAISTFSEKGCAMAEYEVTTLAFLWLSRHIGKGALGAIAAPSSSRGTRSTALAQCNWRGQTFCGWITTPWAKMSSFGGMLVVPHWLFCKLRFLWNPLKHFACHAPDSAYTRPRCATSWCQFPQCLPYFQESSNTTDLSQLPG